MTAILGYMQNKEVFIASDGRVTHGTIIVTDNFKKIQFDEKKILAQSGSLDKFIDLSKLPENNELNSILEIAKKAKGELQCLFHLNDMLYVIDESMCICGNLQSAGCGGKFALAAFQGMLEEKKSKRDPQLDHKWIKRAMIAAIKLSYQYDAICGGNVFFYSVTNDGRDTNISCHA